MSSGLLLKMNNGYNGVEQSACAAVGGAALLGDVKPRAWIFVEVLIVWVPAVPILEAPGVAPRSPGVSRDGLRGQAVTGVPQYPGYKTLTIAPEPFVEQVVRAIHSSGGRIGTHMLLRVQSQDRVTTMGHRGMTEVMMCDWSRDL
jgi:hypothetical protein